MSRKKKSLHPDLGVRLVPSEETNAILRERLRSREWWFFIGPSAELARVVEERFYTGEAATDFQVVIGGNLSWICPRVMNGWMDGVAMGKKSRTPMDELAALVSFHIDASVTTEELNLRDIFICFPRGVQP
jgi:hypothetical protein